MRHLALAFVLVAIAAGAAATAANELLELPKANAGTNVVTVVGRVRIVWARPPSALTSLHCYVALPPALHRKGTWLCG